MAGRQSIRTPEPLSSLQAFQASTACFNLISLPEATVSPITVYSISSLDDAGRDAIGERVAPGQQTLRRGYRGSLRAGSPRLRRASFDRIQVRGGDPGPLRCPFGEE
jgi:hypothetical protein